MKGMTSGSRDRSWWAGVRRERLGSVGSEMRRMGPAPRSNPRDGNKEQGGGGRPLTAPVRLPPWLQHSRPLPRSRALPAPGSGVGSRAGQRSRVLAPPTASPWLRPGSDSASASAPLFPKVGSPHSLSWVEVPMLTSRRILVSGRPDLRYVRILSGPACHSLATRKNHDVM